MKLLQIFIISFLFIRVATIAQVSNSGILDPSVNPAAVLKELPLELPSVDGSLYLIENWLPGKIQLENDKIILNIPIRYDLFNNYVEVRVNQELKIIPIDKFKRFSWYDIDNTDTAFFEKTALYRPHGLERPKGIFKILYLNRDMKLVKHTSARLMEPNYVVGLDMGTKNYKVVKDESYYFIDTNGKYQKLELNKGKFLDQFSDFSGVQEYHRKKGFNPKKENHLVLFFKDYCNSKKSSPL